MAVHTISRRRALALLLLTSILLITLDVNGNPLTDRARGVFSIVTRPFESAALVVWRPMERAWNGITDYPDLQDENDDLRAELEAMRGADVAARAAIFEANELLALNRLSTLANIPTVTAQVVGDAPSNFQLTVEIDKGSESCIATGMPVVGPGGLIGKVTEAYPRRAVVMLITDPRYAVGVKILASPDEGPSASSTSVPAETVPSGIAVDDLNSTTTSSTTTTTTEPDANTSTTSTSTPAAGEDPTGATTTSSSTTSTTAPPEVLRETGILQGRGPDDLPHVRLVEEGEIEVGDPVSTAGGADDLAPDGIPVGTVSRVISRTSSAGPILEVDYSADIDHLNFVAVMLYRPASEPVNC